MARKRKAITERMKIDSLLHHAILGPSCPLCHVMLEPGDAIQWDHGVPDGLGGAHDYKNLRPMHTLCHKQKTIGTKATTAGSDLHMIRKAQRIARGGKTRRGKKIPSRPFPKRLTKV